MVALAHKWQWTLDTFLKAEDMGLFGRRRVQMVNGEVTYVVQGSWHGHVVGNVAAALGIAYEGSPWRITTATLLIDGNAPAPDWWVLRRGATPTEQVGRLTRFDTRDMVLVVEVADTSEAADLTDTASLYGGAGIAEYWVVTRAGVHVHTQPTADGYRHRELRTDVVRAPGVDTDITVSRLLAAD